MGSAFSIIYGQARPCVNLPTLSVGGTRHFYGKDFMHFMHLKYCLEMRKKELKICFSSGVSLRRCRVVEPEKDEVGMGILEI